MTDIIQTKSMNGVVFTLGQSVLRPLVHGRSAFIEQRTVTRIENGRLYLDNSKVAINCPERLWVL
jgi:hypothetical protein